MRRKRGGGEKHWNLLCSVDARAFVNEHGRWISWGREVIGPTWTPLDPSLPPSPAQTFFFHSRPFSFRFNEMQRHAHTDLGRISPLRGFVYRPTEVLVIRANSARQMCQPQRINSTSPSPSLLSCQPFPPTLLIRGVIPMSSPYRLEYRPKLSAPNWI